ncbi:MAG TPA: Mrp/NBP35 family ATP-binding protein [Tepidisphaeraceae bacterium]|nr:Mrp/NBP35 family ATP-binding protein [Tepidisphaeraceae bacterium]
MAIDREQVIAALRTVQDPELYKDIVTLNLVKEVVVDCDAVRITLELASAVGQQQIERSVRAALDKINAGNVQLNITARPPSARPGGGQSPAAGPAAPGQGARSVLPQVRTIIAVGAGKGGVGKSTVAVNLAVALQRTGARVGLMDGDIYGPSLPTMLAIKGQAPRVRGNKMLPFQVHGLHVVTIGALVEEDKPLIWRGPMAHGAFKQLLLDNTEWPDLDYLVVDLPPGTGDVPLTLCQLLSITGAVVVATPQQVALDDAIRAVRMFQQLGAPVLGMIENMSYFIDESGREHDIFGRGGTERVAGQLGMPYLGAIPMFTELRVNSDTGRPHANFEGNPKLKDSLEAVATRLAEEVARQNAQAKGPTLTIS